MRSALFLAGVLAFGSQPSMAAQAAGETTGPVRASETASDTAVGTVTGEKVICRRHKETGSRVRSKKICMTAAQWTLQAAEERRLLEQRQAQRTTSGPG